MAMVMSCLKRAQLSIALGKGACNWAGKLQRQKPHVWLHFATGA